MRGDQADMEDRLRLTLPAHWFGDLSPVLNGVLAGFASVWAGLFDLLQFTRRQSRLSTASDNFLDIAAGDFFGAELPRKAGEADADYRARIARAMRRERGTRAGVIAAASEAGYKVTVFEPAQPGDTGVWNTPGVLAWNVAGGWGSLLMPLESLVTAQPGVAADPAALAQGIAAAVPAGGVAWLRIQN